MNAKEKRERFEKIYRAYEHDVYRASLYYASGDEYLAKEMMQRAFFNLYLHFENVDPNTMRAYVIRSVRNMTYNWGRDFKRLKEGYIEDLNDEDLSELDVGDIYIRAEEQRVAKELSDSILSRLYQKNKRWYEAVVLAYYFCKPQADIAKELGVHRDVICSRLYRAKQWIRENYQEEYDEKIKRS